MLPLGPVPQPARSPARRSAAFAISASFFAVFLYLTLYLQQVLGLSAIEAGLVYLPATIVMFFVAGATSAMERAASPAGVHGRRSGSRWSASAWRC